jgi:NitT/TauT family transport system ATP-binding protein
MVDGLPRRQVLSMKALSLTYVTQDRTKINALADVDLSLFAGEILTIVGPSGCGKSTLLKIMAGLLKPTAGECRFGDETVTAPRDDIGFVFQSPSLLPWATVGDNVLFPAVIRRLDRAAARARMRELLALVGLDAFEKKYPYELSGGMQQRAGIARALIRDPELLLMDEPFGALDALTRERLNREVQEIWLKTKKTIVFVTHSVSEAITLGSRIVVMSARPGRIEKIIDVPFGWPREMEITSTPEAGDIQREIRRYLTRV